MYKRQNVNKHEDDRKQHHSFDVGLFEAKLRAGGLRPKLVYLVPTHGNPRGGMLPFDDRKRSIWLAREFQFYVVAYEAGLTYKSPSPRDRTGTCMPSSA